VRAHGNNSVRPSKPGGGKTNATPGYTTYKNTGGSLVPKRKEEREKRNGDAPLVHVGKGPGVWRDAWVVLELGMAETTTGFRKNGKKKDYGVSVEKVQQQGAGKLSRGNADSVFDSKKAIKEGVKGAVGGSGGLRAEWSPNRQPPEEKTPQPRGLQENPKSAQLSEQRQANSWRSVHDP